MKKITFALLLGAILLVSCSSDEIPETESESMIEGATETTETQETEADLSCAPSR